ncbi:MAG: gamma carbonic anhydrase family protein [Lachnospiraceae bacterium]
MKRPEIDSSVYVAEGAVIRGDVRIGKQSSVWFHATIRAEESPIRIGERTNIQDNAVVHIDTGYPTVIGNNVSVGHGAIVHGCTIADLVLVGMGATILNGAVIGRNCIIGANALVTQHMKIPEGSLVMGVPAKIIRPLTKEELTYIAHNAEYYVNEAIDYSMEPFSE